MFVFLAFMLLLESRREARKAFLAFSGNEGGSEPSQKGSHVSASEEYDERGVDINNASKSMPVSVQQGNDFVLHTAALKLRVLLKYI